MNYIVIIRRIIFSAIVALSLCTVSASLTRPAQAHPGNTAADGAHYCWTNCEYWGETYGERHSHSGGGGVYEEEEYIPEEPEPEYPDDEAAYYGTSPNASPAPEPDYYDTTSENSQSSSEEEDDSSFWWIIGGLGFFAWIGYAIYKE